MRAPWVLDGPMDGDAFTTYVKTHPSDFVDADNYARRLKTLKGLTPYEYICKIWTSEPVKFKVNPTHHKLGLNT
jgi:hypothetical protein